MADNDDAGVEHARNSYQVLASNFKGDVFVIDTDEIYEMLGTGITPNGFDITDIFERFGEVASKNAFLRMVDYRCRFGNNEKYKIAGNKNKTSEFVPYFSEITPIKTITASSFPEGVFPPKLEQFITALAESKQCNRKIPATFVIGLLSGIFQKNFKVMLKQDWIEELSIYTVVSADASVGKTRILRPLVKPFKDFEKEYNEILKPEIAKSKILKRNLEIDKQNLDSSYAALSKSGQVNKATTNDDPELGEALLISERDKLNKEQIENQINIDELEFCKKFRFFINDTTPEAFLKAMKEQGGRLVILSDDARGFFGELVKGKYNEGSTLLIPLLQAFDGEEYTVDRKNDENSTVIPSMNVAIVISVQPDKILDFFKKSETFTSGIASRFLFTLLHKEERIQRKFDTKPLSEKIYEEYYFGVKKCLEHCFLENETGTCVFDNTEKIDIGGQKITASDYMRLVANEIYGEVHRTYEEKVAWLNRSISMIARIAAVLSLWENIAEKKQDKEEHPPQGENKISFKNLRNAVIIVNYFSEIFDTLSEIGNPIQADALAALKFIKEQKIQSANINVFRGVNNRFNKNSLEYIEQRLSLLEEREYIQIETTNKCNRSKPVKIIHVNPKIYE